jgi:WD40 repeat protein
MDRYTQTLECQNQDSDLTSIRHIPKKSARSNRSASRLFGYDFFVSYAMDSTIDNDEKSGQVKPKRGTQKYAAELTRRLENEERLTVFFSEKSMAAGEEVPNFLKKALLNSKVLVVLINKETLLVPGYVRKEVKIFEEYCSTRKILIINIDGALDGDELSAIERDWLKKRELKKIPESAKAIESGVVSDRVLTGIISAREHIKSETMLQWLKSVVIATLLLLCIGLGIATYVAKKNEKQALLEKERANLEVRRFASARLINLSIDSLNAGRLEHGWLQLLAALRLHDSDVGRKILQEQLFLFNRLHKIYYAGENVSAIAFNPNGDKVISGTKEGEVYITSSISGAKLIQPFKAHTRALVSIVFSSDGKTFLSTGREWQPTHRYVFVRQKWYSDNGELLANTDSSLLSKMKFFNGDESADFYPQYPELWEYRDNIGLYFKFETIKEGSRYLARTISFGGQWVAWIGGLGKNLKVFDTNTGLQQGKKIILDDHDINDLDVNNDGSLVLLAVNDGTLRLCDMHAGTCTNISLNENIRRVKFSPDGLKFFSENYLGRMKLWDVADWKNKSTVLNVSGAEKNELNHSIKVVFGEDGKSIMTFHKDGSMYYWDRNTGEQQVAPINKLQAPLISYSNKSNLIAVKQTDSYIAIWNLFNKNPAFNNLEIKSTVESMAFVDGTDLILVGSNDRMDLWNLKNGKLLDNRSVGYPIDSIVEMEGAKKFISVYRTNRLLSWEISSSNVLQYSGVEYPTGQYSSIALSKKWGALFGGNQFKLFSFFAANYSDAEINLEEDVKINKLIVSSDGTKVVYSDGSSNLTLLNIKAGTITSRSSLKNESEITDLVFLANDQFFVSGQQNGSLQIWNTSTATSVANPFRNHSKPLSAIAVSPDGKTIASSSEDNDIRIWDRDSGHQLFGVLSAHTKKINSLAFSSGGEYFASGSDDLTVRIWSNPKTWPAELCKKLTRNMSHKEWSDWVSPDIKYIEQCPDLPIPPDEPIEKETVK